MRRKNIAILTSKFDANIDKILNELEKGNINANLVVLISDNPFNGALALAKEKGFLTYDIKKHDNLGDRKQEKEINQEILSVLDHFCNGKAFAKSSYERLDLLCLINYNGKVSKDLVDKLEGRVINISSSLSSIVRTPYHSSNFKGKRKYLEATVYCVEYNVVIDQMVSTVDQDSKVNESFFSNFYTRIIKEIVDDVYLIKQKDFPYKSVEVEYTRKVKSVKYLADPIVNSVTAK